MKNVEYAALYLWRGKCVGKSERHYATLEEARNDNTYLPSGEDLKFVRRKVGEWEEVTDD